MPYYVISIIVKATSKLLLTSLNAVTVSADSTTILLPCMISKEEPCGIGTFLSMLISSPFDPLDIPIPTFTPCPETFAQVTPIITVVVAPGTV